MVGDSVKQGNMIALSGNTVRFLLVLCGLTGLTVSCKKTAPAVHYTVSDEFKAWADYQKGSYWIYFDKKSQAYDSTYVTDNYSQTLSFNNPEESGQYDQIIITFNSNVYLKFRIESSYLGSELVVFCGSDLSIALSTWAFDEPARYQNWLIKVYPTFVLNGISYTNVYQTQTTYIDSHSNWTAIDCFTARNVGVIQLIDQVNQDTTWAWSLVRSHVVQ